MSRADCVSTSLSTDPFTQNKSRCGPLRLASIHPGIFLCTYLHTQTYTWLERSFGTQSLILVSPGNLDSRNTNWRSGSSFFFLFARDQKQLIIGETDEKTNKEKKQEKEMTTKTNGKRRRWRSLSRERNEGERNNRVS